MKQSELEARALIAGDLFEDVRITRAECFRMEMDAFLGENSGELIFRENEDFELGEM